MNNSTSNKQPLSQPLKPWGYMGISALGLMTAVGLLVLFIYKAPQLIKQGISENVFYVLLIPLGLATAAFIFGGMRSYASFTGKILKGKLELRGPIIAAALVVIGGFKLVPDTSTFNLTMRVFDQNAEPIKFGNITLYLRQKLDIQPINSQGEANFKEIPMKFRFDRSRIRIESEGYRLVNPDSLYLLSEPIIEIEMIKDSEPDTTPPYSFRKHDFESGVRGWRAHNNPDTRGCVSVKATADRPYRGKQSLKMMLSIDGRNPAKRKGEARVKLYTMDSAGKEVPLDLSGCTVSAWLYAPQGSHGPGDSPNGVQLLIKDANRNFMYSQWRTVIEDVWTQLLLVVPKNTESQTQGEPAFDPTQVRILGVKFQTNTGSTATYDGPIWLDHVEW